MFSQYPQFEGVCVQVLDRHEEPLPGEVNQTCLFWIVVKISVRKVPVAFWSATQMASAVNSKPYFDILGTSLSRDSNGKGPTHFK